MCKVVRLLMAKEESFRGVCMSVVVGVSTRQQSGTDVVKFRFLLQLGLRV